MLNSVSQCQRGMENSPYRNRRKWKKDDKVTVTRSIDDLYRHLCGIGVFFAISRRLGNIQEEPRYWSWNDSGGSIFSRMEENLNNFSDLYQFPRSSGSNLTLGARVGSPNVRKSAISVGFIRLIITTNGIGEGPGTRLPHRRGAPRHRHVRLRQTPAAAIRHGATSRYPARRPHLPRFAARPAQGRERAGTGMRHDQGLAAPEGVSRPHIPGVARLLKRSAPAMRRCHNAPRPALSGRNCVNRPPAL